MFGSLVDSDISYTSVRGDTGGGGGTAGGGRGGAVSGVTCPSPSPESPRLIIVTDYSVILLLTIITIHIELPLAIQRFELLFKIIGQIAKFGPLTWFSLPTVAHDLIQLTRGVLRSIEPRPTLEEVADLFLKF